MGPADPRTNSPPPPSLSAMTPASPSLPSSDSRRKWKKRKRQSNPKRQRPDDDDEDDDDDGAATAEEDDDAAAQDSPATNPNADPVLDLRESEVVSGGGHRISDFPPAFRRPVNRPHPSVLALVAADRSPWSSARPWAPPFLENISHGQLQTLSAVLPDHPSLLQPPDLDKPSSYVCTPPPLMEGKGVVKRLGSDRLVFIPMHSDWFSQSSVHRLERQVVPHFFSGKSPNYTPERYMELRNKIVSRYMENPRRRLSFVDCQGLVSSGELYDLSRIVRFLDHWGIINYLVASLPRRELRISPSLLREEANGELQLQTSALRSIDSLILFDRPKCSLRMEDMTSLASASSSASTKFDPGLQDLDKRIRERLSEHVCSYCSCPLPHMLYQSQKEADIILCSDCFHDGKFVAGHSSVDFLRVNSKNDTSDPDGLNWTDQETLLLLEAVEKYNDNWNEIAEHVVTKSKAQCILHFLRLPMEDGLLENIEVAPMAVSSNSAQGHHRGLTCSNSNGDAAGSCLQGVDSGIQLPFANSVNPVMSLVAFLASSIGPRVAAACASASLSVLTKEDSRLDSESTHTEVGSHGAHSNSGHQKDESPEDQVPYIRKESTFPLAPEHVKLAAMYGLSAAVMKSKLFADQEEREIQRLTATIINHQLKRLELKLKQFAELESLLMKECEQVERTRQRLSVERVRMMSTRFGPTGTASLPAASGAAAAVPVNSNTRQSAMPPPGLGQTSISPAYGSNSPAHPHMPFAQRQQMFGFGPRLPLSAIHPSPNPNHHPLLRSTSGNNTSTG